MKCRKCDKEKPSLGAWEVCDACAKVKEVKEEEAKTKMMILQPCPFCKDPASAIYVCKNCNGLKKLWIVNLDDNYNVFTIRTKDN